MLPEAYQAFLWETRFASTRRSTSHDSAIKIMAGCDARHIYDIDRRTPAKEATAQGNRRGAKPRLQAGAKGGKWRRPHRGRDAVVLVPVLASECFREGAVTAKHSRVSVAPTGVRGAAACRKRDPFISSESNLTTLADDAPYVRYGAQRSAPWQTNFRSKETLPLPHAAEVTTKEINRESS